MRPERRREPGDGAARSPRPSPAKRSPSAGRRRRKRAARPLEATPSPRPHETTDSQRERSPAVSPRPLRSPAIVGPVSWRAEVQILACAGMTALGSTLGFLFVQDELHYHVLRPGWACELSVVAAAMGVVVGLWLPRRFVLRRLGAGLDASGSSARGSTDYDFAASLSGGLIVALGLVWAAICAAGAYLESYRAALVHDFLWPASLVELLLCTPVLMLIAIGGMVGTATLIVIQGWYRVAMGDESNVVRLWVALLLAGGAASIVADLAMGSSMTALGAPLVVFLAGMLAVLGSRGGGIRAPATSGANAAPTLGEWKMLATIGAAAGLVGIAYSLYVRSFMIGAGYIGVPAIIGAFGVTGIAAGRWFVQIGVPTRWSAYALLVSAVSLSVVGMIGDGPHAAWLQLACVAFSAALCTPIIGRRIARRCASIQVALSWVGVAMASGLGVGVLASVVFRTWLSADSFTCLAAVVASGVAWLALRTTNNNLPILGRRAELSSIAAALVMCIAAAFTRGPATDPLAVHEGDDHGAVRVGRELLDAASDRIAWEIPRIDRSPALAADLWRIDASQRKVDLVAFASVLWQSYDPHRAERLMARAVRALAAGGRVAVELPTDPSLVRAVRHTAVDCGWREYEWTVGGPEGDYHALVFGRDIPEWISRRDPPTGYKITLAEPTLEVASGK